MAVLLFAWYCRQNKMCIRDSNYTLVRGGHRDDWKRGGRGSAHQQSQQKHERKKAQHGNTGMPLVGFGSGSSVQPLSEFMYHVQRVHPFTAPFVKPASRYVCPKRKTRIEGSNIHRLAAIARPSCFEMCIRDRVGIHGALQAIGYGLLVLFFAIGVVKTCGSFVEVKRPEHALDVYKRQSE